MSNQHIFMWEAFVALLGISKTVMKMYEKRNQGKDILQFKSQSYVEAETSSNVSVTDVKLC